MQKYQSLKDSGVAWLGDIPTTWSIKRAKYIFSKVQEKPRENDEVVTAFRDGEVVLRRLRREDGFTFADKEIGYQHVSEGDLVVHAMDAFAGAIGVSKSHGKMSPVCSICRPVDGNVDTGYYSYLLRSMTKTNYLIAIAKGIRERSTDFRYNDLGNMVLPLPSLNEQKRIVEFLNEETTRIDNLIAKQEYLLELLEEKRNITISNAVTRGIQPREEFKETHNPWLPSIPKNWKRSKLGYYLVYVGSGATPRGGADTYLDEGVKFLRSQNVLNGSIRTDNMSFIAPAVHHSMQRSKLHDKDVLLNITGGSIGRSTVVPHGFGEANVNQHVCALRTMQSALSPYFLCYILQSSLGQSQIFGIQSGSNREGLNYEQIRNLVVPIPTVVEQLAIVSFLDTRLQRIALLKQRIDAQIGFLKERRESLISNVVTGKVKV